MSRSGNVWSGLREKLGLPNKHMENHTTIDQLAAMIQEGFKSTANKEDIKEVRTEMNQKLDEVGTRLDRIEHLLLAEQKREIEDLKQHMKRLEDALAV
jgi:exonuclease I